MFTRSRCMMDCPMRHRIPTLTALVTLLASTASTAERPNVVMLLSDDLGYQDIGCYDGPVKTPTFDGLAAAGTGFTDFYSGCAVCSPSRATLLTGRHHIRAGVYSWIHDPSQNSHPLEREITLAEILKQAPAAVSASTKVTPDRGDARR